MYGPPIRHLLITIKPLKSSSATALPFNIELIMSKVNEELLKKPLYGKSAVYKSLRCCLLKFD